MTPNTPLPIPSKAAIRALRGLVLGTSCTLALIAEDRRRRINAARCALRNGDRIRSARRYHAGGSAFAVALEEESLAVEPGVIHWTEHDGDATRAARGSKPAAAGTSATATTQATTASPPPPGLLDWSDSVPSVSRRHGRSQGPDRQSTSWRTSRLLRTDESPVALTAASLSLLTSSSSSAPASASQQPASPSTGEASQPSGPDAQPSSAFPFPPPRTALSRHMQQRPAASLAHQAQAYCDRTRPRAGGPNTDAQAAEQTPQPLVAVDVEAAAARIRELAAATAPAPGLETAVQTLAATAPVARSPALWDASAVLCRACQAAGRMDLAQAVLQPAVRCGPLNEATYFAHDPLPVVRAVAPLEDLPKDGAAAEAAAASTPKEVAARRRVFAQRVQDAAALFLPPLAGQTRKQDAAGLAETAQALLACALAVRPPLRRRLARDVFAAVAAYPGDLSALTHWFTGQLRTSRDYETLLWAFLARPPTDGAALSDKVFFEMGDGVVEAVRLSPTPQAAAAAIAEVLQRLLALCSETRRLKTAWVADLLYAQWQRTHDFAQTQRLFAMVGGGGGGGGGGDSAVAARVYHANGAYRAVVQIALEAGRASDAQRYFDELVAQEPAAEGDVRLLGLFALAKAKQGDWAGVRADFATAAALAGTRTAAGAPHLPGADRVFVPIVQEHLRTHAIGETEAFLRAYMDELGVPAGRELVTLLANAYGALGEVRSFVGWLAYCAGAGFAVDAAFSNAILQSCHRHWKVGYHDLRALHRQLCALSPRFEDAVTQAILAHAALAHASKHRRHCVRRPRPLSSAAHRPAGRREDDLYLAMKQAFAGGHPAKTVRVYRHAVRDGRLVPGGKWLKLAVAAALRCGDGGGGGRGGGQQQQQRRQHGAPPLPTAAHFDAAIDLLRDARAAGQDIDAATTYIALAYIDALCPQAAFSAAMSASSRHGAAARAKAVQVAATVKDVLGRLAACGVQMSDLALNRAAFHLFRAGHPRGAVALALAAADAAGTAGGAAAQPGYNVWNFCVLVSAHAQLADAAGIRRAAAGAAARGAAVTGERLGYHTLKQARRLLRRKCAEEARAAAAGGTHHHAETEEALRAVDEALAQAKTARQRLGAERVELQTAAMAIMRRAAQAAAATAGGPDGNDESVDSGSTSSSSAADSLVNSASSRSRASSLSSLDALEAQVVAAKVNSGETPVETLTA